MYLQETFHLKLTELPLPMLVIYNASSVGSIGGGWLSSSLINRGWTINAARKTAMLVCALCVLPVFYVPYANKSNMWEVVADPQPGHGGAPGLQRQSVHHDVGHVSARGGGQRRRHRRRDGRRRQSR